MIKLIGKYIGRSSVGQTYQILEYQEFIDASTKDGEDWIPGLKHFELSDGRKLNFVDDRTWKIVSDGTILSRLR